MTRTRFGNSLSELLVVVAVVLGLSGMLAHAARKVRATDVTHSRVEPAGNKASASLTNPRPRGR
jgi:hypothetical protein